MIRSNAYDTESVPTVPTGPLLVRFCIPWVGCPGI